MVEPTPREARALDSGEEKEGLDARLRMLSPGQIVKPTQRLLLPKGSLEQFLFSPRNILFEGLAGSRLHTYSFLLYHRRNLSPFRFADRACRSGV
jgi:hypothetical protein